MSGWFGSSRRKHRILVLGPRSAGKTTVIYRLSQQPVPETMMPTAADVLEKYVESSDGHRFVFAEQKSESPRASALIYVLSKNDVTAQLPSLKAHIEHTVNPRAPLAVVVNKQDDSGNENSDVLDIVAADIAPLIGTDRSWAVMGCSSSENRGIDDVLVWLEGKLPR